MRTNASAFFLCAALGVALTGSLPAQADNLRSGSDQPTLAPLQTHDTQGVPGRYLVLLKEGSANPHRGLDLECARAATSQALNRANAMGIQVEEIYYNVGAYLATLSPEQIVMLRQDPEVLALHQDRYYNQEDFIRVESGKKGITNLYGDQEALPRPDQKDAYWHLDRVDQRDLPLNKTYSYTHTGKGVNVYVMDTGVRVTHQEFKGRTETGWTPSNEGWPKTPSDDHAQGHGTHVAGLVGGTKCGVAKEVTLIPLKIFKASNPTTTESVFAGAFDWLLANAKRPGILNCSWGFVAADPKEQGYLFSEEMIRKLIAKGIIVVAGAGNDGKDVSTFAPARMPEVIAVSATAKDDSCNAKRFNWGAGITLFAPGVDLRSASNDADTTGRELTGTSMATPIVSGAAALYLEAHPEAGQEEVKKFLIDNASKNNLKKLPGNSPNRLVYTKVE